MKRTAAPVLAGKASQEAAMRLTPIEFTPLAPDGVTVSEEEILADLLYPAPLAGGAAGVPGS